MVFLFPETCRKIVGDGSTRPHPAYRTVWQMLKDGRRKGGPPNEQAGPPTQRPKLKLAFGNPFGSVMFLSEPVLGLLLTYSAIVFAGFYAIATAMPEQLKTTYHLTEIQIGLMYLPMAGGSVVAAFVVGPGLNWNYRRHARRLGMAPARGRQDDLSAFPVERARLEVGLPLLALAAGVLLAWGWALQYRAGLAVPCVLLFLLGVGMIGFNNASMVLVTDVCPPGRAGAATAANNLTRCLLGAAATAAVGPMVRGAGAGWAFSIWGFLYLLGAPALLLLMKNGVRWRRQIREKEERRRQKKGSTCGGAGA